MRETEAEIHARRKAELQRETLRDIRTASERFEREQAVHERRIHELQQQAEREGTSKGVIATAISEGVTNVLLFG